MKEFNSARKGFGTKEWAEHNVNIGIGCSNGCIYCYARKNALDTGKIKNFSEWTNERVTANLSERKFKKLSGVVMFPTQHDITLGNVETCLACIYKLLEAGNSVLIVSKPRLDCTDSLCNALKQFKGQILFRFTIGSISEDVCRFWEPYAPTPNERIEALKLAFYAGYKTSVSAEPMLEGYDGALDLYGAVHPYITDDIWFGKMNFPMKRVDVSIPENLSAVEKIETLQRDEEVMRLYKHFKDTAKVAWKESVKKVVGL